MRSLFFNYLCARDKGSRNHMQTALMTIFEFTPEEVMEIRVGHRGKDLGCRRRPALHGSNEASGQIV